MGWSHRVRIAVQDNVELVLAALVVLGLAGAYVTYATHVDPGTTVETREAANWESVGEFAHHATVAEDTAAFEQGTRLRNRSVYFRGVTPTLEGAFTYAYAASDGGDLTANVTTTLVLRSVPRTESSGESEYWRVERPVNRTRASSLGAGEQVRVPFSVNVSGAVTEARAIDEEVGPTPGQVDLFVESTVRLSGTRNGRSVDVTRRYQLPIAVQSGVYRVTDPGRVTNDGSSTERVTVPRTHGPVRRAAGPLLLVLSLAGGAALALADRRDVLAVPPEERSRLAHERTLAEFDDWITTGSVPRTARVGPRIEVDSLEGLVDVAIDTNERVIEDADRGEYVVISEGVSYVYYPPILDAPDEHRSESVLPSMRR